jgi:tetratricopeptide (TPR) repeat protein
MKRVEAAIEKGHCVLAFGGRTLSEDPVLAELRRRGGIPAVSLGGDPVSPAVPLTEESLAPAMKGGGLVVIIEPDAGTDGRALEELGRLLQAARQKPRVHVVARSFNPFLLPMSMRLMKLDQHKTRAKDFMSLLPMVGAGQPSAAPKKAKEKKVRQGPAAPHVHFLGRELELPAMKEALPGSGPLVVLGPNGIGRTWLVEQALSELELTRLPDFAIFDGSDFDTLAALLAHASGDEALKKLVSQGEAPPAELIDALMEGLKAESLAGSVMVFDNLRFLQHPDGAIARRDRISMLAERLLTGTYAPRIVFITDRRPAFFKVGETSEVPLIEVGGLKGRELHGIFESYLAGDVERNKMGEAFNLTGGHPMATRALAIGWRNQGDSAIDDRKVIKMPNADDIEPLMKLLSRRVEKLPPPLRAALALCAHSRLPLAGTELAELGLKRDERIELLRRGLLEALPWTEPREYRVHSLVRRQLPFRDISDFDVMPILVGLFRKRAIQAEPKSVQALAWDQHANRVAIAARRHKDAIRLPYPDDDSTLAAVAGILRMRNPRLEMALQMVRQVRKRAPNDPRPRVAEARIQSMMDETVDLGPLFAEAREACPTPELFHSEVNWRLARRAKGHMARAAEVLAAGREAYPQDGTLARRLGALLQEQGKFAQAEEALRAAIEIEPGAPEAYSRLGEVLIHSGPERWADAENAIRYALDLDGERPVHRYRLARLLRRRSMVLIEPTQAEERARLQAEAKELLEDAMKAKPREPGPYLELAQLLLEIGGDAKDLERAEWAIGKAEKIRKTPVAKVCKARILARRGEGERAEAAIQRLLQGKHPYQAHAALSELYFAQRKVFMADQELAKAIAMCPEDRLELGLYKVEKAKLEVLISSGQALEIEKMAEDETTALADSAAREVKTTHDRGTVVRRRGGEQVEIERAVEAPAEAAPVEAPAEAAPVEAPAEAAPVEAPAEAAPVEAPAEAAPVEAPAVEEAPQAAPVQEAPVVAAEPSPEASLTPEASETP